MNNKIYFADFSRQNVAFQMRTLVNRFFPQSWQKWLSASQIFTLYDFMVNKAFGNCSEEIGIMFDGRICECAGMCTFVNIGGNKGLLVADSVEAKFYQWPEWGFGTYAEVVRCLTKYVTKTEDPWKDYAAAMWERLELELVEKSKGARVFEALGILGGIWNPANSVEPEEKDLDISES